MSPVQAHEFILHEVKEKFKLQRVQNDQFFWEWQTDLVEPTDSEKQWLDRVRDDFLSLEEYSLHEEVVKLAVLSPLISLAGFFHYPFHPEAETEVRISVEDENEIIRGKIDVLVLLNRLWIAVIESKRSGFSLKPAIPQALFYMMANPQKDKPTFGFITNGSHFRFIKLVMMQQSPQYALSDEFTIVNQENSLYKILVQRHSLILG